MWLDSRGGAVLFGMNHNHITKLLHARVGMVVLSALAILAGSHQASAAPFDREDLQRIEQRVQEVAAKGMPAVVALSHSSGKGMACGTGTIVTPDGIILTANHVVADAQ